MLLSGIVIYSAIFTALATAHDYTKSGIEPGFQTAQVNIGNNLINFAQSHAVGPGSVSSVAGVASRNGRVSSYSGVYSRPGMESPMIITSGSTRDIPYPLTKYVSAKSNNTSTITKRFENEYATGMVNISPGSVSVTSIAKSGPHPVFGQYRHMALIPMTPMINNPYIQRPLSMFEPRYYNYNPWFSNNIIKNTAPSTIENLTPPWFHPRLNSYFNYWP